VIAARDVDRTDMAALDVAFGWAQSGWPDFSLYAPVFAAAPSAQLIGGDVPRDRIMQGMSQTPDAVGLGPLNDDLQAEWEAEMAASHCDALPQDMLFGMVTAQRLRDTHMAGLAAAMADLGGPVVVITGNGHARTDRGIPAILQDTRPDLTVWALGQSEGAPEPDAPFDALAVSAPAERSDPCAPLR